VPAPLKRLEAVSPRSVPDWDKAQTQIALALRSRI
jgi:hypothetical protein